MSPPNEWFPPRAREIPGSKGRIPVKTAGLTEEIILFSRFLKDRGFRIFSSNVVEALRSLEEIDISGRQDYFSALRANLVTNDMEWRLFGDLFEVFWRRLADGVEEGARGESEEAECAGEPTGESSGGIAADRATTQEGYPEKESFEGTTYSPVPSFEKRDLSRFHTGDIQVAQLILKNMMALFRIAASRRSRRSNKPGDIEFRRTMNKSLKTGGIPFELFFRKRKKRLRRLVVLADVSGSMERYARLVMPFILGLRGVGPRAEVFVFSTSLTSITPYLRRFDINRVLETISRKVPDWSGGTRIGNSLQQFNERHGERLLNDRTVVVIMSDGWDLGARRLLKEEMETLKRKAHTVVWLNPLVVDSDSFHLSRGMEAALPYVDYFLPANSLESLKKVGKTICSVMSR